LAAVHVEFLALGANAPALVSQQHFQSLFFFFFALLSLFVFGLIANLVHCVKSHNAAKKQQ
jgi:hypothetical protein